jgi:hypothetical protein
MLTSLQSDRKRLAPGKNSSIRVGVNFRKSFHLARAAVKHQLDS